MHDSRSGVQMDPVQARLHELMRRWGSQQSLIRTLQATQIPLNEDPPETAWWTTEATELQRQPDDDAWWNGNGGARAGLLVGCILEQHQANEQSNGCADVEWRRKTL